ncbi:MAG: monovalent cation/H+ antiporter complex subunit F [Actinomycetaceae bacterium]|nr:monovalent cation/H+ antiporter complex subunit F [Actinomycetaceae bacterium]
MTPLTAIYTLTGMVIIATFIITLVRLTLGPTLLDRAVASDIIAVGAIGLTALVAVTSNRNDVMVLTIVFTLIGFLYSVTIGRFSERIDSGKRILTPDEAKSEHIRLIREAQAELHAEEREALKAARAEHAANKGNKS